MTEPSHYKSNLRDLQFNLFEALEVQKTALGRGPFESVDEATARELLETFERVCTNEVASSFKEGDHVPLKLDGKGNVAIPEGLKRSIHAYFDAGLHTLALPAHLGGVGAPPTLAWATFELLAGANAAVGFYIFAPVTARTLDRLATPEQKRRFLPQLVEKRWGGTMVLTEPDAGSDVGAGRTVARKVNPGGRNSTASPASGGGEVPHDDDLYELEGVKRFITNGDFDAADNIVHLVLARPEGKGPGTKGLSMFIVPKFWVNEDGSVGERNGVFATNVEKKLGIKGSATCELTFGDGIPARGLLVGNVHDGIRQMFHIIEHARMAVGVKSLATLSTGYLNALAYAKERVQGVDLGAGRDKNAKEVRIVEHPDVRRMLMAQKAHAEGLRALALFTASVQDAVELEGGHDAGSAAANDALNDLLLPLVKGYGSEKAYELLALSLQTLGGSGYLQDYPIEQYLRDAKIDTLYEGTTHIQALDLLLRKVARDGGATLQGLFGRIRHTVESNEGGDALAAERALLRTALGDLEATFGALLAKLSESLYHAGLQGNRVLFALAETTIAWLLLRHAAIALRRKGENPPDAAFYDGKVASARWFARNVLPNVTLTRRFVEESELSLMALAEESF